MSTGNRHKRTVNKSQIPSTPGPIPWGIDVCCDPFLVLASITDGTRRYNDITLAAQKLYSDDDSATFTLVLNGVDIAPLGLSMTFPKEEFISAFVVDWRQHLAATGAGCYQIRCDYVINGVSGSYIKGTYNLAPWSKEAAKGTVRILSIFNDFSRKLQIDFTNSGASDTFRFDGFFGNMQPNYEIENLTSTGFVKRKVENEDTKSYELQMYPTTSCYTSRLIDEHLLHANELYITDHTPHNHRQDYIDYPVILKKETTPAFEYTPGSNLAAVTATFEDKVQTDESQFAGSLQSGTNASFILVGEGVTAALPIHIHNANDTFQTDQYPPDYQLPQTTVNVYVYGVFNQTAVITTLDPSETINIS